jgi:hypothetical protein
MPYARAKAKPPKVAIAASPAAQAASEASILAMFASAPQDAPPS